MESLSQAIAKEVHNASWQTIKMGKNGPKFSHLFFADHLILFGTTSQEQVTVMQRVLENFCTSSGHKISQAKTKIFFSRNVPANQASNICSQLGYQKTCDLGTYLGVSLLHERVTTRTYEYIISRLQQKLASWKIKTLSLAGRITLAKSALCAIPYYSMQTSKLPSSCLNKIEQLVRNFVWGSDENQKKTCLIKWTYMCQPLLNGGCGFRHMEEQNKAFLSKLAYKMMAKPQELWVQVITAKYKWTNSLDYTFNTKSASHTWRSIAGVWEDAR